MNKTIIIVLVVAGLSVGAYFLFFKKKAAPKTETTSTTSTTTSDKTGLAGVNLGDLGKLFSL